MPNSPSTRPGISEGADGLFRTRKRPKSFFQCIHRRSGVGSPVAAACLRARSFCEAGNSQRCIVPATLDTRATRRGASRVLSWATPADGSGRVLLQGVTGGDSGEPGTDPAKLAEQSGLAGAHPRHAGLAGAEHDAAVGDRVMELLERQPDHRQVAFLDCAVVIAIERLDAICRRLCSASPPALPAFRPCAPWQSGRADHRDGRHTCSRSSLFQ